MTWERVTALCDLEKGSTSLSFCSPEPDSLVNKGLGWTQCLLGNLSGSLVQAWPADCTR